jgi:putative nucleotidyltransferase with HDIG domain
MKNEQAIRKLERIVADDPNNFEILFQLGKLYADANDLNKAIDFLERTLSANPHYINARYDLGIVFSRKLGYDYAVKEWQKIIDEDGDFRFGDIDMSVVSPVDLAVKVWNQYDVQEPDSAYKYFTLGFVFYALRKLEKCVSYFDKCLKFNEKFDMAHYFLGLAYNDMGDYDNAAKAYTFELTLRPQAPNICYHFGVANYYQGKIQQAIVAFQKAIQFRPRYLKAHFQLGLSYSTQAVYPSSEKHLRQAIEYKPTYAAAHLELGNVLHRQYKMDEAAKEMELAIKCDPKLKDAAFKLGELKKSLGKMDEALEHFRKSAELDPNDGDIYYYIGSILAQQKKYDEAAREFQRALTKIPNHDFAMYALGEVLFNMGDTERAIKVYQRGILLNPTDNKFRNALGRALFKTNNLPLAIEEFQKVLAVNPRDPFAHYFLGLALFKTGDLDRAVEEYQNSVDTNPNSAYGHFCLGASYSKKKEFDLAIAEFEKGAELMPSSEAELSLFGTLQLLATIGIEHASQGRRMEKLYIDLREVYRETVRALANAIDSRDPYTRFHSVRVSRIARFLATHIRKIDPTLIEEIYIEDIEMGGLLHDVGKIGIPDYIVGKPAKLTDEEMAVMRKHPVEGVRILQGIQFPWDIIPLVRHHHEKFNGRGYPDGLVEDATPFGAMIIGISDVYDALVTDRPYRKAYTAQQAMEVIEKLRKEHFADGLVDAFAEIVPNIEPLLVEITPYRRE